MLAARKTVEGGQHINQAAREHDILRTTLKDRVSGKVTHGSNPGPKPYLNTVEENELGEFLKSCTQFGYSLSMRFQLVHCSCC